MQGLACPFAPVLSLATLSLVPDAASLPLTVPADALPQSRELAARQPEAEASSATRAKILVIFSAGSGSPITPVEARKTSDALQPTTALAASATARTPAWPACPVKALVLPLFTTTARACPRFSWARHHSTGAEAVLERVKTPATSVPGARTAKSTSVRSRYLIPASPVASLTPANGGRWAKLFGASGDMALAEFREKLARRGIKLMLDFVPNHTAPDHPWVKAHPDYYVEGSEEALAGAPQNYLRVDTDQGPKILAYGRDPKFCGLAGYETRFPDVPAPSCLR